jgi:hypothetical protein
MSQPETQPTQSAQPWRKPLGYVAVAAFLLLFFGVQDAGSVEIYGVSVPIWLFGLVNYLIGVLAMFSFQKR